MNAHQYSLLIKALTFKATVEDLTQATGFCRQTITKALKALRQQQLAYICDWDTDEQGRAIVARWAVGEHPDARRPGAQVPAEKQRAYRARKKYRS